jgi:hypothetical protein
LEAGLLAPELCLFGDNAYINSQFMATPYTGVGGGSKDAYNFFHSQLRIRVECAFGLFTERWSILRRAMPRNISLQKTIAMVISLAKLHNFCINQAELTSSELTAEDNWNLERSGGVPLQVTPDNVQGIPLQLIGGGHHMNDHNPNVRRDAGRNGGVVLPRERLLAQVEESNLSRPKPYPRRH